MKMRSISITFLSAVMLISNAPASEREKPSQEPSYSPMPWHLADVWWDLGIEAPFQSYAIDVTISDDIPSSSNLYIAPIGLGHLSKTPFYGGIQTQLDGHTKNDPVVRKLGPGFLFSMWDERSLDAVRPSLGGFCQSSGHEGDFVSIREPYKWQKGKYTFNMVRMDEEEIEENPFTWVGIFVYSHENDENVFVGALRFKGKNLVLDRKIAGFVEVYGDSIPVGEIPRVAVTFGNPVVNGKPVKLTSADAVYPEKVPDYADAEAKGDELVITVGKRVEGRTKRNVRLIPTEAGR